MNRLTVCLLTYNRFEYAERTLKSFLDNVLYSVGPLGIHIADDGSGGDYVERLKFIAGCYENVSCITTSVTDRRGYGGNFNKAAHVTHWRSDFMFMLEDDWEIRKVLDLDLFVKDLTDSEYQSVRMGYVGWNWNLFAKFVGINGRMYLHLLPQSPEQHVFSGHPRLETVSYQKNVGPWPEYMSPGDTEIAITSRTAAREGVLWPLWVDDHKGIFRHIGEKQSYWLGR